MKVNAIRHIIVLLALLALASSARAEGISALGASQIGDNTARAIDYDPDRYDREISLFHDLDNGILPAGSPSETVQRLRHSLLNHTYWVVHYTPRDRKGGDGELAVFVDSKTGAILGIYTGK